MHLLLVVNTRSGSSLNVNLIVVQRQTYRNVNAPLTYYTACGHNEMLPRQHLKLHQSHCLFEAGINVNVDSGQH